MSRSYKKTPCCHIAGKDNSWKKLFNRRLRRVAKFRDLPNGNSYKKANESWNISDFKDVGTKFRDCKNCDKSYYEKCYLRK